MTINLTVLKTTVGWPLTTLGGIIEEPWNDSPGAPAAVERAPDPIVSRVDSGTTNINWSPDSLQADRADVRIRLQLRGEIPIAFFLINWGDGGPLEAVSAMGLPNFTTQLSHTYWADALTITAVAYTEDLIPVDSGVASVSFVRSSDYLIHQYRIERYKGTRNYQLYRGRWYQDWTEYTGSVFQTNVNDYDAPSGWNWGYRIWLRDVDDQDRPGLTMWPSGWVETGTGEGS